MMCGQKIFIICYKLITFSSSLSFARTYHRRSIAQPVVCGCIRNYFVYKITVYKFYNEKRFDFYEKRPPVTNANTTFVYTRSDEQKTF